MNLSISALPTSGSVVCENEFSPSADEDSVRTLGELIKAGRVAAWQVSTMKKSSLYLKREISRRRSPQ